MFRVYSVNTPDNGAAAAVAKKGYHVIHAHIDYFYLVRRLDLTKSVHQNSLAFKPRTAERDDGSGKTAQSESVFVYWRVYASMNFHLANG